MYGRIGWLSVSTTPVMRKVPGPWEVRFPKGSGAPESVVFKKLVSWTKRPEAGIKHFSGTAVYRKQFDAPASLLRDDRHLALDLGNVKNIAEVTLNGKNLGVLWKPPYRVDITGMLKPKGNLLEIKVTNVKKLTKDSPLPDSGVLGPVLIMVEGKSEVDS